jgi:hypothetical protein
VPQFHRSSHYLLREMNVSYIHNRGEVKDLDDA